MQDYLKNTGIKILNWPEQSLDPDPIQNIRHIISSKLSEKKKVCYYMVLLQGSINEVSNHEISQENIEKLISSMFDRCKAVIKACAGPKKY